MNIIGKKFGELEIRNIIYGYYDKKSRCLVRCSCGKEKIVRTADVKRGKINSCGHLYFALRNAVTHDMSSSETYKSWVNMIRRCTDKTRENYKYYGARGITVCERWINFENFLEDMGPRPEGMSIDRIDNNGNYEPNNCKWSSIQQQNQHRRVYIQRGIN